MTHHRDTSWGAAMAALTANLLLAVAKAAAYGFTGSAAMLSEALHSLADCFNQVTLLVGISASERAADEAHPYGYGRSRWTWAVISAMGVLFIGAGVSVFNGVDKLRHPEPLTHLGWAGAVLALALVLEGATLLVGLQSVRRQAREANLGLLETMRWGPDPVGVAVVVEDAVAVVGVGFATASLAATWWTGRPIFDALGSIAIGLLLAVSAAFLVQRNLDLLAARAMTTSDRERVLAILRSDPLIEGVSDVKTTVLGPDHSRFKAEIVIDGRQIARRFLEQQDEPPDPEVEVLLEEFADRIIDLLGAEIDRIEERIQQETPGVLHIDLELDRPHHEE